MVLGSGRLLFAVAFVLCTLFVQACSSRKRVQHDVFIVPIGDNGASIRLAMMRNAADANEAGVVIDLFQFHLPGKGIAVVVDGEKLLSADGVMMVAADELVGAGRVQIGCIRDAATGRIAVYFMNGEWIVEVNQRALDGEANVDGARKHGVNDASGVLSINLPLDYEACRFWATNMPGAKTIRHESGPRSFFWTPK